MLKLGLPTPWKTTICLGNLVKRVQGLHYSTGRLRYYSSKSDAGDPSHGGDAKKALEDNPEFQKLAEDYASHDHIHMRESETEKNDYFKLGSMLTRVPIHENLHTHTQPNPLLVLDKQEFRKNKGVRITWIGLLSNVGLAAGKFIGGIVFHSQALLADAVHALSDLVSDFLTLFTVTFASKKPTNQYPYGYGKIETVGSLAVSVILTMAGVSIGWASLCSIVGPFVPHALMEVLTAHLHVHSHVHDITNINAAWIAGGSIFVKEWIFRATKKVAIETSSNVLMANAWHHRVDSLTSLVALVTISSGCLFDIQCLDAVGGLMVSGLVVNAGYKGMFTAVSELVDRSLPTTDQRYTEIKAMSEKILRTMLSNNNSGKPYTLKHLSVLMSGPNAHANMILEAPIQRWDNVLTISEIELVTDHLRSVLYKDIPYLRKLDVEYVEERPALDEEERKQIELQKKQLKDYQPTSLNPQNEQSRSHSHSHSHSHSLFPFGKDSH